LTRPAKLHCREEASMKRILTGASRAVRPDGLGSPWKWLIAGALAFGIAPVSAQAQGRAGAMRAGRFNQPSPPMVAASPDTNRYAMNPYMITPYMMTPSMPGNSSMSGIAYASGPPPMNSGTSGALAGYGGQGYEGMGYGQPGTGQTAPIAAAT